eukprot:2930390-Ditylum_brightwellii.AAC.1
MQLLSITSTPAMKMLVVNLILVLFCVVSAETLVDWQSDANCCTLYNKGNWEKWKYLLCPGPTTWPSPLDPTY